MNGRTDKRLKSRLRSRLKDRLKDRLKSAGRKKREARRAGLPPGPVLEAPPQSRAGRHELFRFDEGHFDESGGEGLPELDFLQEGGSAGKPGETVWFNVLGVEDGNMLSQIGDTLGVHPVVLEDIQNTVQRPKMEEHDGLLFVVFRMLSAGERTGDRIASEQISLLVGEHFIVSFQEHEGDIFDPVRDRIRSGRGRIRRSGADYLAYALLDLVVDEYFLLLEGIEEELEELEDRIEAGETDAIPGEIRRVKQELITVRRAVRPLREVVDLFGRELPAVFREETGIVLRDLGDHVYRVIDTLEMLKETLSLLGGVYQATLSNNMNSVMKVLTIIATVFIPLTFIAGIYGMNFQHMPELAIPWAYPAVLGLMGLVVAGMFLYFKKKGWF